MIVSLVPNFSKAQQMKTVKSSLSDKEIGIISISSLAAKGDLAKLKPILNSGLDAGLTVNEVKEVLVHLYAYCGFPRSIRGLQTLMAVLNERKVKGIIDPVGKEASVIEQDQTLSGYAAFAPTIDTFLKEHLFADIFERDVLSYAQRELVTISVIATIGHAEPMLQSHLGISLNVGITANQLKEFVSIIKNTAGVDEANAAQAVLAQLLKTRGIKK